MHPNDASPCTEPGAPESRYPTGVSTCMLSRQLSLDLRAQKSRVSPAHLRSSSALLSFTQRCTYLPLAQTLTHPDGLSSLHIPRLIHHGALWALPLDVHDICVLLPMPTAASLGRAINTCGLDSQQVSKPSPCIHGFLRNSSKVTLRFPLSPASCCSWVQSLCHPAMLNGPRAAGLARKPPPIMCHQVTIA